MAARAETQVATDRRRVSPRQSAATNVGTPDPTAIALQIARSRGLLAGPKTKHFNAKVSPRLFDAAAKRLGSDSPAAVIQAALATLATQDDLGPWLARNMGSLADLDPELLAQLDI